jgi:3-isopropylmalate dehydrogenase
MKIEIMLLPGDGVGPEVIEQSVRVLKAVEKIFNHVFLFESDLIGGCSIDKNGSSLTDETIEKCKNSGAVLMGAVGGPKWENLASGDRPERGLLRLRKELGVYANIRPVRTHPKLINSSPLKPEKLVGVDMIVIRELTGGLYFGQPKMSTVKNGCRYAVDTLEYYDYEIRRIVELAFSLARERRKKVTSVDKANVLESSRLWRQVTIEVGETYPDVKLEHMLVDTASMRLVSTPTDFDVLVTENMFGDILTDEASVLSGSMGMLPSASVGDSGPGLYEPIHGSAPDIAGKGIANPLGAILSVALMLRHSFSLHKEAKSIEKAVDVAIDQGAKTIDLGGKLTTKEMADQVLEIILKS